ncbi:MAG: tRNA-intron lyase [Thaumarchaeota archaeon]|nr:tRNA-intron lyase [Nitrososphaerota archaeon]MBT6171357.1 tRNA-intron lyase [Nitrososphaerota archaeon]MBT7823947.1 tRNA-intron lyase [Nitrososphaerota archaeon]
MSFDFETKITAKFIDEKTIVINPKMQNILNERGFGESQNDTLILNSFETLYLLYNNKLELKKVNKNIVFDELIQKYIQKNDDILTRFLLYRDLRTKGYVVKDGFGFDSDFRVYEKGTYGQKDAKFLIFAFNEGTQQKIGKLYKNIHEITQMGKEPIIAVIERRGEIIYYKINKMNFLENKSELEMKDFNFN